MGLIANLFNTTPTPAAPATPVAAPTPVAPAVPGNIPEGTAVPAPATPGTEVNGVVPAPATSDTNTPDSPLAQFGNLWEPVATKAGEAAPATPAPLDPAQLQEIISKASFTSSLTPENLSAIEAGGEGAQQAFTESLNSVAQQVLMQATLAANKMTEQAVKAATEAQAATIPEMIRAATLNNTLQKENPVFSNPAVRPVIEATQTQLAAKFPNATPDELATMTKDYITAMGAAFAPAPVTPAGSNAPDTVDWESHFLGN